MNTPARAWGIISAPWNGVAGRNQDVLSGVRRGEGAGCGLGAVVNALAIMAGSTSSLDVLLGACSFERKSNYLQGRWRICAAATSYIVCHKYHIRVCFIQVQETSALSSTYAIVLAGNRREREAQSPGKDTLDVDSIGAFLAVSRGPSRVTLVLGMLPP